MFEVFYYRRFGRRVRTARTLTSLTEKQMANEIGISVAEYRKIESGKAKAEAVAIAIIAEITGKTVEFLVNGRCAPVDD